MLVYILLFNAGTDNEGIHTVQVGDSNTILMFQEEDDAVRYAGLLEAQDFLSPKVEPIDSEEVEHFCRQANYDWRIIEPGELEIPPERNVENFDELDWQEATSEEGSMPDDELERIRRQLEGLL